MSKENLKRCVVKLIFVIMYVLSVITMNTIASFIITNPIALSATKVTVTLSSSSALLICFWVYDEYCKMYKK